MNTLKSSWQYLAVGAIVVLALGFLFSGTSNRSHASQTNDVAAISNQYRIFDTIASTTISGTTFISQPATTTNATSTNVTGLFDSNGVLWNGAVNIAGAKKVNVYFTRGGAFAAANTGTSTFAIQVSPDGTNWYYENKLVVSTSTPGTTLSGTVPLMGPFVTIGATLPGNVATSTLRYALDLTSDGFQYLRCIATIQVDGANSCQVAVTF